jgi:uridine kinase
MESDGWDSFLEGDVVTPERSVVLGSVAGRLAASRPGHPLRVGIDGVCGSGKTTFSHDLAEFVAAAGRTVVLVDSDGFHHVRARRYRQGRESAQGYYDDAYDFSALAERVLRPLGPGGTRDYAVRVHDLASDATIDDETGQAPPDAVVLFAATFIQRDQLRDLWDEVIYLDVQEEVATARGIARDLDALGGPAAARAAYEARYMAACRLYIDDQGPHGRASILIDNTDPDTPVIRRLPAQASGQGSAATPRRPLHTTDYAPPTATRARQHKT